MPLIVPQPLTCLVTGVTGFIGAHVAKRLLDQGFIVKGTIRSRTKGAHLENTVFASETREDRFSLVEVADMTLPGAFDAAVTGCDIVFHVASPFTFKVQNPYREVFLPAIAGTQNLLEAAHKFGGSRLKKVVVTSSFAAMMEPHNDNENATYVYTEKDWCDTVIRNIESQKDAASGSSAYVGSKGAAERAAWQFVADKKPVFKLSVVNPVYVFGPTIHAISDSGAINTSAALIYAFVSGERGSLQEKRQKFQNFVDVRDVAEAHVRAALSDAADNERFICTAGPFSDGMVAEIIRRNFPDLKAKLPENAESVASASPLPTEADNTKIKRVLEMDFISLEQSVVDTINSIRNFITAN